MILCSRKLLSQSIVRGGTRLICSGSPVRERIALVNCRIPCRSYASKHIAAFHFEKYPDSDSKNSTIMATSQVRQNFHAEVEAGINKQINMELYASYVYLSMAAYFDRDDVALPNISKFFRKQSREERDHAEKFIDYQNKRGGRVVLNPIDKPSRDEWGSPLDAMTAALELEKTVNAALLALHGLGSSKDDAQFCDFMEGEFLEEQVESIKELGNWVTQLKRVGPGLGEFEFDRSIS
ncbi:unnamed protein product [Cyprideis torosa]|uniref:Ferritin n=1 Tax=Cyprideis torosa TaxID=163714 RepID=A0A7R8WKH6_9CRUS|nr:unnamed protein product [Cyprideis torosa]CAG0896900.1 unnamed protein product [Cyprideis torosa]